MEKVRPWCGQPSDRGRLNNRTEQSRFKLSISVHCHSVSWMWRFVEASSCILFVQWINVACLVYTLTSYVLLNLLSWFFVSIDVSRCFFQHRTISTLCGLQGGPKCAQVQITISTQPFKIKSNIFHQNVPRVSATFWATRYLLQSISLPSVSVTKKIGLFKASLSLLRENTWEISAFCLKKTSSDLKAVY